MTIREAIDELEKISKKIGDNKKLYICKDWEYSSMVRFEIEVGGDNPCSISAYCPEVYDDLIDNQIKYYYESDYDGDEPELVAVLKNYYD